jgi:hypothetical protein
MRVVAVILITLLIALACTSALAAVVQGQFATGQNYTADYSVSDVKNGDGMTVERLAYFYEKLVSVLKVGALSHRIRTQANK